MKQLSRIDCGQPDTAVPNTDKWALLNTLTEAADSMGLNHRTLSVLRALLSFFPERTLPADPGSAVVFPSNATLSQRLNGMPESTLRRHLATLVKTGIVSRQDSPNRKRFTRRFGLSFGFDLSPLARAAETMRRTAAQARDRRDRIANLRTQLACVRARLLEREALCPQDPIMESARLTLRRKTGADELQALLDRLEPLLQETLPEESHAHDLSGSNTQNERHIQSTEKESEVIMNASNARSDDPPLGDVLTNCQEYKCFFPESPPTWKGILSVSQTVATMLGIDPTVYGKAQRILGLRKAAVTILCLLEHGPVIRCPTAYLLSLITRAEEGRFNLHAMLNRRIPRKLSADNPI